MQYKDKSSCPEEYVKEGDMRRIVTLGIVLLLSFIKPVASEERILAEEVLRNLDLDRYTKSHIQEYVRETKGKTAYGKGKVVDVSGKRGNFRIRIKVSGDIPPAARGEYNVTLITENPDAIKLDRDALIEFEGVFKPRRGAFYKDFSLEDTKIHKDMDVQIYAKKLPANLSDMISEYLKEMGLFKKIVRYEEGRSYEDAIVLEGRFTKITPGSRLQSLL